MNIDRRRLLALGAGGAVVLGTPGVSYAASRPKLTHGVQSGDVTEKSAILWTRADRRSDMVVELSHRPDFKHARTIKGPKLTGANDHTGKVTVRGLDAGRTYHYRVRAEGERKDSEPLTGTFTTASDTPRDVRFQWSGDLAGQGWGINPDFGGYRIFATMAESEPDFFLCSGDFHYADGPLEETVELPDGSSWRNVLTDEKLKVAETLDEYRGQYKYNLLDEHLRAYLARVPIVNQWDDHEVVNNWYPGEILDLPEYTEKNVDVLAARARKAFGEYTPSSVGSDGEGRIYRRISYGPLMDLFVLDMRSYKDANDANDSERGTILGDKQLEWLKRELAKSKATWKILAADLPIGLVVPDGTAAQEGIAQGDDGEPLGREAEIADLLSHAKRKGVRNIVFLTADVHYTAAHHYSPDRAAFGDFDPFWEFVSGPLNAGGFGPNDLEGTFGPEAVYVKAPPEANTSPAEGYQFFGEVHIDAETEICEVALKDLDGNTLFTQAIEPIA